MLNDEDNITESKVVLWTLDNVQEAINSAEYREYKNKNYSYRSNIAPGLSIYNRLGVIKKKNDGRYHWIRNNSTFHTKVWDGNNQQGTCSSLEEAKKNIEKGWITSKP